MSKSAFVKFAIENNVLSFGEFTLKSGRKSPYFYNAGEFDTGQAQAELARYYAQEIINSGVEFELLFGPAYKGIPLVSAVACSLWKDYGVDKPFAFNRKEAKDHGEGGVFIGAPIAGRVLVIDDVLTAGTAFREAYDLVQSTGAQVCGLVISLDRQERAQGKQSAVQEIEQHYNIPVISIVTLQDMLDSLTHMNTDADLTAIAAYQAQHGIVA